LVFAFSSPSRKGRGTFVITQVSNRTTLIDTENEWRSP
jgi:hypothetical protein